MALLAHRLVLGFSLLLGVGVLACGGEDAAAPESPDDDDDDDGEKTDRDAGRVDAGKVDASRRDAGPLDAGKTEEEPGEEPTPVDAAKPPADASSVADTSTPATANETGALPAVTDLTKNGPFTAASMAGPSGYVLFFPQELGKDGVKHPIVTYGPGAAENAGSFTTLLKHYASHGFAVISYDGTPDGQELIKGLDWMVAENDRSGSMFYQKLDTSKVAAGGHSAGSLATFKVAADKRFTTTVHLCGGTFDPHTDIKNLHAPALFICGDSGGDGLISGDVARPNCDIDFMNVTVPVFYGNPKGAAHMSPTEIGDAAQRTKFMSTTVGWLRWQLAGDETRKSMFLGSDCTLCKDSTWKVQTKNW